jgi:hypothetical protein
VPRRVPLLIFGEFVANAYSLSSSLRNQTVWNCNCVHVDLALAIAILVSRIFTLAMADRLMTITPFGESMINIVFVSHDSRARANPAYQDRTILFCRDSPSSPLLPVHYVYAILAAIVVKKQ